MFDFIVCFQLLCYTICMKENLIYYRTCVCNINYHMVWSVKYRRKILTPDIEEYLQELVQQIAEDKALPFIYLNVVKVTMSIVLYQLHQSCL